MPATMCFSFHFMKAVTAILCSFMGIYCDGELVFSQQLWCNQIWVTACLEIWNMKGLVLKLEKYWIIFNKDKRRIGKYSEPDGTKHQTTYRPEIWESTKKESQESKWGTTGNAKLVPIFENSRMHDGVKLAHLDVHHATCLHQHSISWDTIFCHEVEAGGFLNTSQLMEMVDCVPINKGDIWNVLKSINSLGLWDWIVEVQGLGAPGSFVNKIASGSSGLLAKSRAWWQGSQGIHKLSRTVV